MIGLLNKCMGWTGCIEINNYYYSFTTNYIMISSGTTITNRILSGFGQVIEYNGTTPLWIRK